MAAIYRSEEIRKDKWVAPDKQLDLLIVVDQKIVSLVKEVLPLEGLANMIVRYAAKELPPILTNWYTNVKKLNIPIIPPLPEHIWQIIEERCIFYGQEISASGTFYTTAETNTLTLVAEEWKDLGTLFTQIESYLKSEKRHLLPEFEFPDSWILKIKEHAKVPFATSHWILTPKDIGGNQESSIPEAMVGLKKFQDARFTIPSLHEILAVFFSDIVATGYPSLEPFKKETNMPPMYDEREHLVENDSLVMAKFSNFWQSCYCRIWRESERLPRRSDDFACQPIPVRRL